MPDLPTKTVTAQLRAYAPEWDLILFLRQCRNALADGETGRIEIELEKNTFNIIIVDSAKVRRVVLAAA